jgi:hypothetical protein
MSEIRTDGGLGVGGRGSSLNNDPLNNNQPHNSGATRARLLKDFATPQIDDMHSSIDVPAVDLNNFELKLALISMVQQNQFVGLPTEDSYLHISIFLGICDIIKINGASSDAIRLRLFPFSP